MDNYMKEYKKIVKNLAPFFEAHHMDLHEQFDLVLAKLARIEAKLDMLEKKEFMIVDEVEIDPAKIERPIQEESVAKIKDVLEDPCTDKECEDDIAYLYNIGTE